MVTGGYSADAYRAAFLRLGPRVTESHRRMLAAHANAPGHSLDVAELAAAAGQVSPEFTHLHYGGLGHELARALGHRLKERIWTRMLGEGFRSYESGLIQWTLHPAIVRALMELRWTEGRLGGDPQADIHKASAQLKEVDRTTRQALIDARLHQGLFRDRLITYWGACAVTNCSVLEALTASHIKPWRSASNRERLDQFNGLLLVGTLDRLFDSGMISFDEDGLMLVSDLLPKAQHRALGLRPGLRLRRITPEHRRYMKWHRDRVFAGEQSA